MKYTNSEKKALYESIMRDVAKTVKKHLNEADADSYYFADTYEPSEDTPGKGWEKDDGTFVVYKYDELQRLEKNAIIQLVSNIWNYRPTGKFHKDPKTYEKFLKDIQRVCMNYGFKGNAF